MFADREGLEALSMRGLAKTLNAGVMTLYNHVSDKDDLIDGMLEVICEQIDCSGTGEQWKSSLRRSAESAYRLMQTHRWVAKIWNRPPGPFKNRYLETLLRIMNDAGFSEELSCRGFHALTMHVAGFSFQAQDMPFSTQQELRDFAQQTHEQLDEQTYPNLRAHIQFHLAGKDKTSDFSYVLNLILDGLERDLAG